MTPTYSTWRLLTRLFKGQLDAQNTLNNWLDALDKCAPYAIASVNVNALSVANTLLYTVPLGKTFEPWATIIRPITLDTPSGTPTFAVGSNSTAYDNLISATALDVSTTAKFARVSHLPTSIAAGVPYVAGDAIYCRVSSAASGTTYMVTVDLFGRLR